MASKGINSDLLCPICKQETETIINILRDCEVVKLVWQNLGINNIGKAPIHYVPKPIRWEKPPRGWIKLNTNGSSLGNSGLAGGGGVFRNDDGGWILGFSKHIGITSTFMAKLWAIWDGLALCKEKFSGCRD